VAHLYQFPGTATVQLVVSGPAGASTNTHPDLVVATAAYTVGDGIPDWWRALSFGGSGGTTNGQSCEDCDADGDGLTTRQEYLADTDPTNEASRLELTAIAAAPGGLEVQWIGGTGVAQVVEATADLPAESDWTAVATNPPPTEVTNALLHGSSPRLFYRIRAQR